MWCKRASQITVSQQTTTIADGASYTNYASTIYTANHYVVSDSGCDDISWYYILKMYDNSSPTKAEITHFGTLFTYNSAGFPTSRTFTLNEQSNTYGQFGPAGTTLYNIGWVVYPYKTGN